MIIHQPEFNIFDGQGVIWTRIETEKSRENFPDILWCRVPGAYASFLSLHSDAFLCSAIVAGMHYGEKIDVRGTISPRLAYALGEYQFLLELRLAKYIKRTDIKYNKLAPLDAQPKAIASTFSGGVDSLFTVKTHLPEAQPLKNYQLTHAVFLLGFDISQQHADNYAQLFSLYEKRLERLGIDLIPIESNFRRAVPSSLSLNMFYGPVLAAYGMALGNLFKRFFIPSSRDYAQLAMRASSSEPLTDRFLSTETLDIIHSGATHRRIEKIEEISNWQPAQDLLRVCNTPSFWEDNKNCSRCEKCTRTMVPLFILGKLKDFHTFRETFRGDKDILRLARKYDPRRNNYAPEFFLIARNHKLGSLPWLYLAAFFGTLRYWLLKLLPAFIKKYLQKRGYFIPTKYQYEDLALEERLRSQ